MNVIAVDWVYGSTGAYPSAVENVTQLALSISQFISKLLVSYCAFPVEGGAWLENAISANNPENCSQLAVYRSWMSRLFIPEQVLCSTKEISFLILSQSRFGHGTLGVFIFHFLLSFDIFWKNIPVISCFFSLGQTWRMLWVFSVSCFSRPSISAQKFCQGSWRTWAILYLLWASDVLSSSWKSPDVSQLICAQHSWTTRSNEGDTPLC